MRRFPYRAPESLTALIDPDDAEDPIARQIDVSADEARHVPGFSADPVGEATRNDGALLQKYAGRALLITTQACDVHCRYCFRRSYDYAAARSTRDFSAEFAQIRADASIGELILSGGDPLTLSNTRLHGIIAQAETIPHLTRLRIHSRSVVVRPERVDAALCQLLDQTRLDVVVVTHANCAQELSEPARRALQRLRPSVHSLLNQAVLLRGVNDSADALARLSEQLFTCGVLPYYLHMLDPVEGAAHFAVPESRATALMRALRARVPGYLVPELVREIAGQTSKTPVHVPASPQT